MSARTSMSLGLKLSLGANVALAAVVGILAFREAPSAPAEPSAERAQRAAIALAEPAAPEAAARAAPGEPTPEAIAELERMGLSREVIVNALLGDFHRKWDERAMELERRYSPRQVPEREYLELARARDAEQVRAMKAALGAERYLAWDKERTLGMMNFGRIDLSPEEADRAYRLQKEFEALHAELLMAMEDGLTDMADASSLQEQAQQSLDRGLQELLGAERFAKMRGAPDPVADVYRVFGDLSPTPQQAQAVVRIDDEYRAREAALARRAGDAADASQLASELDALAAEREGRLREVFGAEAYEAAARQRDPTYQKLSQFADAWQLGEREVESVYEALAAFHDHAERARAAAGLSHNAGQPVDWRAVDAAIERARQETEAGLQAVIGQDRLALLKRNEMLSLR